VHEWPHAPGVLSSNADAGREENDSRLDQSLQQSCRGCVPDPTRFGAPRCSVTDGGPVWPRPTRRSDVCRAISPGTDSCPGARRVGAEWTVGFPEIPQKRRAPESGEAPVARSAEASAGAAPAVLASFDPTPCSLGRKGSGGGRGPREGPSTGRLAGRRRADRTSRPGARTAAVIPLPGRGFVRLLVVAVIRFYQTALSPLKPPCCRFVPTCSEYAVQAIRQHGVLYGGWLALRRICRCHPFYRGCLHDPVPDSSPAWQRRSEGGGGKVDTKGCHG